MEFLGERKGLTTICNENFDWAFDLRISPFRRINFLRIVRQTKRAEQKIVSFI